MVILTPSLGAGCTIIGNFPPSSEPGLDTVSEAWDIIVNDYVDKDELDSSVLSEAAIKGMLEALNDPYSTYLDVETYQLSRTDLTGIFEGIGAYVAVDEDEQIVIIAPFADSPADKAGIRAGDIILEVDGESVADMSLVEAIIKIRGPTGTVVKLLVLHEGETEPESRLAVREKTPRYKTKKSKR